MARFLVVDREPNSVSALKALLEEDGHEVDAYTAGHEAAKALVGSVFDAVLTDLEMPEMAGPSLLRIARHHNPKACILASSAKSADGHVLQQACHFFQKPLQYERVVKVVSDCRARGGPGHHGRCYLKSFKR